MSEQMESRWCAMVLLAFLVLGWCECCLEEERVALSRLKPFFPLIDYTNDVSYYPVEEKETSLNCCEWERVECNPTTGRVIKLFLDAPRDEGPYGLHNRVPWYLNASLFLPFQELKNLSLGGNYIAGCVADQGFERLSSKLKKLEILDLSENYFNDSIFMSLSELSSLKFLDLSYNFPLTGSNHTNGIKMLSRLNNLETLILSRNSLSNNILSQLHGFTSLKSLNLQLCGLEGTVDLLEFSTLKNLKELYLGGNEIESLGSSFQESRLMNLEVLDLRGNRFNNSILSSLGRFPNLRSLSLGGSELKGSIDIKELVGLRSLEEVEIFCWSGCSLLLQSFGSFPSLKTLSLGGFSFNDTMVTSDFPNSSVGSPRGFSSLKHLRLSSCEISQNFTLQVFQLKNLESLDIYLTPLANNFLEKIGAMPSLKFLSIWGCGLNGTLHVQESRLMNLEVIDLRGNLFNNSILSSLGRFPNLRSLSLGGSELKGSIDIKELVGLRSLEEVDIFCYSGCSLLLQSFVSFPSLKTLSLGGFSFNDTMVTSDFPNSSVGSPREFSSLKHLELFECEISQNFTLQAFQLKNLESLDISETPLANNFLEKIGAMPSLKFLSIWGCGLNGTLHVQELVGLRSLEEVDILCYSGCSLLLQSFGSFPSLKTLSLGGFSFNDTMVTSDFPNSSVGSPREFSSLKHLGLFGCEISQNFTLQLSSLKHLELSSCEISQNFTLQLSSLKYLELSSCEISQNFTLQAFQLKNLESLDISYTPLANNFLEKIGAMPSLKFLRIDDCGLNGTLHVQGFCDLMNVRELDIAYNNLTGNLPECISNFTSLESLDLSSNQLYGKVSALKSLTSLVMLRLYDNYFRVPISLEPFFNLSKLKFFDADNNLMYVESEMQSLVPRFQLNQISLSCCGDVGQFPAFLYHQHDLQYVDLSNVNLKGKFPNWLLQNNTNLASLSLANNSLIGPFKLSFFPQTELRRLDVSKNFFYGEVPIEIGEKLPSLRFLNMSKNHFHGTIPASIGDMNYLEVLDLSDNQLSGGLPEGLTLGCSSLNYLALSNNRLQGQMFSSKFNLTELFQLRLDGNHFSGKIPDSLSDCSSLSVLDLSNNHISGEIPNWMENMSQLTTLDLSNNEISGEIPRWMGNMSRLEHIAMAQNHLEGPFPVEFCNLNLHLKLLDLSMNNISGHVPSCFSPLWINQVHLSRNKLQGPITNAFRNSSILVTLDLSNNHLTGKIPNWIGNLSQLSYLLLNNNHFEGKIPLRLCNLDQLSLIDLSNNNLSGTVPSCLMITAFVEVSQEYVRYVAAVAYNQTSFSTDDPIQFTSKNNSYFYKGRLLAYLSGIDLSCNKLTGEIPHQVKNFQNIYALNLSHNRLIGSIPPTFSDLKKIESLDLSHNNLSGTIPPQLVELYSLSYFSVAYNNLSGSTPVMTAQFSTFEESSYVGNPLLCGKPLPKNCSPSEPPPSSLPKGSTDNDLIDMTAFYASFVASYVVVILSIASVLYINPYWRRAWFYHIGEISKCCYYFLEDHILPKRFLSGN
ncbi:receptor-like protein 15 isoform X2 [Hibiscus syriacus]|uniref:receptor-like protein 15 isoform X2 n=1 Tax=Hibiscus syriacus TaxID=106335 RepID=UPI001923FBCC|nr:receptor-like protein 15 isoform X2 [Hibiscus syriacus]